MTLLWTDYCFRRAAGWEDDRHTHTKAQKGCEVEDGEPQNRSCYLIIKEIQERAITRPSGTSNVGLSVFLVPEFQL